MPSITTRELRAHFSRRLKPDYFGITVRAARAVAAPAVETHWGTHDQPICRGTQLAACGS